LKGGRARLVGWRVPAWPHPPARGRGGFHQVVFESGDPATRRGGKPPRHRGPDGPGVPGRGGDWGSRRRAQVFNRLFAQTASALHGVKSRGRGRFPSVRPTHNRFGGAAWFRAVKPSRVAEDHGEAGIGQIGEPGRSPFVEGKQTRQDSPLRTWPHHPPWRAASPGPHVPRERRRAGTSAAGAPRRGDTGLGDPALASQSRRATPDPGRDRPCGTKDQGKAWPVEGHLRRACAGCRREGHRRGQTRRTIGPTVCPAPPSAQGRRLVSRRIEETAARKSCRSSDSPGERHPRRTSDRSAAKEPSVFAIRRGPWTSTPGGPLGFPRW